MVVDGVEEAVRPVSEDAVIVVIGEVDHGVAGLLVLIEDGDLDVLGAEQPLVYEVADGTWRLSETGWADAARTVRNHRLWEAYLINYADIAPSHVDRDADQIEHVLGWDMVRKLESLIADTAAAVPVPPSPHAIGQKSRELL